ncbi:PRD domain protein [Clostridiales bacterium 1_7_47FAA]|uniref:BglG family transcription antiterminator n=1 Tax=Enterocloster hominis (ex Hitch et al. 2024) TaxID=1917870 RepID=A0ABV1D9S1_9FIRM|nr:PRD domain protein [Clostridiales bacterium 1_7_47FAA]
MNKSKRQKLIIKILADSDTALTCRKLAKLLDTSENTIRNDLDDIEGKLRESGAGAVERKPGVGIRLVLVNQAFLQMDTQELGGQDDRKYYMLRRILCTGPGHVLTETRLSEELFVSRSSISRELDAIGQWLGNYNLQIEKRRNHGISLKGKEFDKRRAIAELFFTKEADAGSDYARQVPDLSGYQKEMLGTIIPDTDTASIKSFIRALEKRHDSIQTHRDYVTLFLHIALSLYRSKNGCTVDFSETDDFILKAASADVYREEIDRCFQDKMGYAPKESERDYIFLYVIFSGIFRNAGMDYMRSSILESARFGSFVHEFLEMVSSVLGINIPQDGHLYENLKYHLSDMICRMKIGMTIRNPLLHEIKDKYPSVFGASWAFSILFEKYFGLMVNDNEIAFIATYLLTAREQLNYYTVTACIVCNYGVSVAQLICEKLKYRFPNIHVTDVLAYEKFRQLCQGGDGNWDMVISTIGPLEERQTVVCVSPILTEEDEKSIEKLVKTVSRKLHQRKEAVDSRTKRRLCVPGLVAFGYSAADKMEAIRLGSDMLKKLGYVTDGFVDSVIKREMAVSTEVGFGFAIPHGSPKFVRHSGIAVVRLDKTVLWHSGEAVDTIFLIAACTDKRPQDMDELKGFYKILAVLLDEEGPRKRFKSLNKAQDICNYINGKNAAGQS